MKRILVALLLVALAAPACGYCMTIGEYQNARMSSAAYNYLSGFMAGLKTANRIPTKEPILCVPDKFFTAERAIHIIENNFTPDRWAPGVLNDSVEDLIVQVIQKMYPCLR